MTVVIRLEADWGLPPYYVSDDDGPFDLYEIPGFAERFALPGAVIDEIEGWNHLYQRILNWDDPASSAFAGPEDERRFYEQGRVVARLLRQHVPPDVKILYVGDGNMPAEYY